MKDPNSESTSISSMKEGKGTIICEGCGGIPFLRLGSTEPLTIKYLCKVCRTQVVKSFKDLVSEEESERENKDENREFCEKHKNKKNLFYCKKCNKNFCEECKLKNKSHEINHQRSIVVLSELPSKEEFTKKIQEAKNYLEENIKNLQEKCIKRLQNEIKRVNSTFKKNIKINSLLVEFAKLLETNYNECDYASIKNLIENTHFIMKDIDGDQPINDIIKEVESNFLLKPLDIEEQMYGAPKFKAKLTKEFSFHTKGVRDIQLLKDCRIASGSLDQTIKIINPFTEKCEISIKEEFPVYSLVVLKNGNLGVGLGKGKIKIYDIQGKEYNCINDINAHSDSITKLLCLDKNKFLSASRDKTIKIFETGEETRKIKELKGHEGWVVSVIKLKSCNKIVSGSYDISDKDGDGTVRIWDLESDKPEKVISQVGCCSENSIFELEDNKILVSSAVFKVFLIDLVDNLVCKTLCFKEPPFCFLFFNENIIYGGYTGRILSWNSKETFPLPIIKAHKECIFNTVYLGENQICTCSRDKTIKVWNIELIN